MSGKDEREPDVHLAILERLGARPAPERPERAGLRAAPARLVARTRAAAGVLARVGHAASARTATTAAAGVARGAASARAVEQAVAGVARSVTSAPGRILQRLPAASDVVQGALPGIYGVGVAALVLAAGLGWLQSPDGEPSAERHPATAKASGRPFGHASDVLRDPSVAEEAKLAVLENVAADPRESATKVLLSAAGSDSLLVSMAGIRALRGRPCDRVQASLTRRLTHDDWQRRAWAAKVLGENGCADAVPDLKNRLAHEPDDRVRRELSRALTSLGRAAR